MKLNEEDLKKLLNMEGTPEEEIKKLKAEKLRIEIELKKEKLKKKQEGEKPKKEKNNLWVFGVLFVLVWEILSFIYVIKICR